jgi:hypothetical protein
MTSGPVADGGARALRAGVIGRRPCFRRRRKASHLKNRVVKRVFSVGGKQSKNGFAKSSLCSGADCCFQPSTIAEQFFFVASPPAASNQIYHRARGVVVRQHGSRVNDCGKQRVRSTNRIATGSQIAAKSGTGRRKKNSFCNCLTPVNARFLR